MRILVVHKGNNPVIRDVPHSLSVFQSLVGGKIEIVEPFTDNVVIVCDESGRINGKPVNRIINDKMDICGDFFLCGHDGEGLTDFPVDLVEAYKMKFSLPVTII